MRDDELPDRDDQTSDECSDAELDAQSSLSDDIASLIEDGRTYAEAELAFQKSRVAVSVRYGKSGLIYTAAAFAILHMALLGLVMGSIIALIPVLGPWGATSLVVGILLITGALLVLRAKSRFSRLAQAFSDDER